MENVEIPFIVHQHQLHFKEGTDELITNVCSFLTQKYLLKIFLAPKYLFPTYNEDNQLILMYLVVSYDHCSSQVPFL